MQHNAKWFDTGSVYQIYVRSFADSDGDGIGDLDGITQHLDHVASLGVDAIWLNPCYPSPQRDHGYDVSDYMDIEPAYGDLISFDRLVARAHSFGIKVLMDIVPNHCSSDHPWFRAAVQAGPGSPERARFYFRPGQGANGEYPPNNWQAIFGGSAWTRVTEPDGTPGEWYLGVFTPFQPDWNFYNPEVADFFDRVLTFWFDRGVDGFRADAVIYLGKVPGLPDASESDRVSPLNPMFTYVEDQHEIWRRWRSLVNAYQAKTGREILLVAEAFSPQRPDLMVAFANDQEFHQAFAFDLMLAAWQPDVLRSVIEETLAALRPFNQLPAWTMNNHDTQRSATRLGRSDAVEAGGFHAGQFRISTAPIDAKLGLRRARAAAMLTLGLPGCVYLYAGEELGLPEVLDIPANQRQDPVFHQSDGAALGRDGCRVPLPWTVHDTCAYGFSLPNDTATPINAMRDHAAPSWLPQPNEWGQFSVEAQSQTSSSTLALYQRAGRLRRELAGLRGTTFTWIDGLSTQLIGFERGEVLVMCNPTSVELPLPHDLIGPRRVVLSSSATESGDLNVPSTPNTIAPDTTLWIA